MHENDEDIHQFDIDYLIQQAEEKQKLEERVKELEDLNSLADDTINLIKDKNQRYKQALEKIRKLTTYDDGTEEQVYIIADEALNQ